MRRMNNPKELHPGSIHPGSMGPPPINPDVKLEFITIGLTTDDPEGGDMTQEELIREQAEKLGGSWRMEHGHMPVVVLTTVEADDVIKRLEAQPLVVQYKDAAGITHNLDPKDVTLVYWSAS